MDGFEMLGNVMQSRMMEVNTQNKDNMPCLGTVNAALAIVIDGTGWTIPKGGYMVASRLDIPASITTGTSEGHSHTVNTGVSSLRSGVRVLVVWVGNEPIVVDVVHSS